MTLSKSVLAIALVFSLLSPALAQQPVSDQTPPEMEDRDEVLKIATNLVQVDTTLKDKSGKIVTDSTADDFQIFEDVRPPKIT